MKKSYPVEFVYQTLSLIIAVIVVHAVYVLVVRPKAEIALGEQRAMIELDPAACSRALGLDHHPRLRARSLFRAHDLGRRHHDV